MIYNTVQEGIDIAKGKRKIIKFQKAQQEFEKGKRYVPQPGEIGNMAILKSICPKCDGTETKKKTVGYHCYSCKIDYIDSPEYSLIKKK